MKKALIWIAVLVMAFLPFTAHAAVDFGTTPGGVSWSLDMLGNLKLEGGETVPADGPWNKYENDIRALVIGDGIRTVETHAFYSLVNLRSVTVGKDVEKIEKQAFAFCDSLKSVTLLNGQTEFSGRSFWYSPYTELRMPSGADYKIDRNCVLTRDGKTLLHCLGGKEIKVPAGVEEIDEGAFCNNQDTATVILPDTLKTIRSYAFEGCDLLTTVTVPPSVTTLGQRAFWYCDSLRDLYILGERVTLDGYLQFGCCYTLQTVVLPAVDFANLDPYNRVSMTFDSCSKLQKVIFTEGTTEIPGDFFAACRDLREVYIPSSVKYIDDSVFSFGAKQPVIRCVKGSYAEQFAAEKGYRCVPYIQTESITLTKTEITIPKGKNAAVKETVAPRNVSIKEVKWFSTDSRVATVSKGKIRAVGEGECDIVCQAMDGSGVRGVCHVTVEK